MTINREIYIHAGQCYWDQACKKPAMCPETCMPCNILCVFWHFELDVVSCKGIEIGNITYFEDETGGILP